ncbi:hypothetical protein [Providencia manganoxydans]|uniref:hypothetical protein n=1 Tax=Providencia manganoxydans TaxID=2923283 RepID=UPI0034E540DD
MNDQKSDDEKLKAFIDKLKTITSKQFIEFLDERNVNTICVMCGEDGKQVIDETDHSTMHDIMNNNPPNTFVTFFHHQAATPGDSDINYYYKLTCSHCGFITTHSVRNVLEWLESRLKEENQ